MSIPPAILCCCGDGSGNGGSPTCWQLYACAIPGDGCCGPFKLDPTDDNADAVCCVSRDAHIQLALDLETLWPDQIMYDWDAQLPPGDPSGIGLSEIFCNLHNTIVQGTHTLTPLAPSSPLNHLIGGWEWRTGGAVSGTIHNGCPGSGGGDVGYTITWYVSIYSDGDKWYMDVYIYSAFDGSTCFWDTNPQVARYMRTATNPVIFAVNSCCDATIDETSHGGIAGGSSLYNVTGGSDTAEMEILDNTCCATDDGMGNIVCVADSDGGCDPTADCVDFTAMPSSLLIDNNLPGLGIAEGDTVLVTIGTDSWCYTVYAEAEDCTEAVTLENLQLYSGDCESCVRGLI